MHEGRVDFCTERLFLGEFFCKCFEWVRRDIFVMYEKVVSICFNLEAFYINVTQK